MKSWIAQPQVVELLEALYADAAKNDPLVMQPLRNPGSPHASEAAHRNATLHGYMAVDRDFGRLLYSLARSSKAKTVIEFGTSFGVSAIHLASAIRDNREGKLITTEFHAEKAERAKNNLAAAGLEEWVEFRVGDARETLKTQLPDQIDFVFLDGAKGLYLDILKLLEPHLRPGAIIASDNTDKAELVPFLEYVRMPRNGYLSSAILTPERQHGRPHEITVRI